MCASVEEQKRQLIICHGNMCTFVWERDCVLEDMIAPHYPREGIGVFVNWLIGSAGLTQHALHHVRSSVSFRPADAVMFVVCVHVLKNVQRAI